MRQPGLPERLFIEYHTVFRCFGEEDDVQLPVRMVPRAAFCVGHAVNVSLLLAHNYRMG
jgi:hypothetical protein